MIFCGTTLLPGERKNVPLPVPDAPPLNAICLCGAARGRTLVVTGGVQMCIRDSSDRFTVSLSDPTSTRHIVLNTTHDILGDVAVRKALQHATNRQAISEGIFYGLEPAADTLYSPTVPYLSLIHI